MTKFDFILAQFRKTFGKKYENYVITRLYNLLNDDSIKFITQQYVRRPSGYALLDIYFPQFDLYLEIDEGQHKNNITSDELRCRDVVDATNFIEKRIIIYDRTQEDINYQIDEFISYLKDLKQSKFNNNSFKEWNIEQEMNPDYYIELGYLDVNDNVALNTQNDVFKCFGKIYQKPLYKCTIKHPIIKKNWIWCPKFFAHKDWSNELSDDNSIIKVIKKKDLRSFEERFKQYPSDGSRMVFGHIISPLGDRSYKFLGYFEFDYDLSVKNGTWTYKRTSTRINTLKVQPKKEKTL